MPTDDGPAADGLERAIDCVQSGGIVLYPTATLWGIGGDARHPGVIGRVRRLKGRASSSPFLLLVPDVDEVLRLAPTAPSAARRLMEALWPGPLTLLLPAGAEAPAELVGPEGLIGLRLPEHPVARALVRRTRARLVSTSANPTGEPPALRLRDVAASIRCGVDAAVDGPPAPSGAPSTIVSFTADGIWRIVREGVIGGRRIEDILSKAQGF